jgi:HD-GYP domain-containing protein (c-di-GMP phosphodiesterase class II)
MARPGGRRIGFRHRDVLAGLDRPLPLGRKLTLVHDVLQARFPFIDRIAVARYDSATRSLRTFVDSTRGVRPLVRYEASLDAAPSLAKLVRSGRPRVVNDLSVFDHGGAEHTRRIRHFGSRASYTMPVRLNDVLWGVLFFNSTHERVFSRRVLVELDVYGHLVSSLVSQQLATLRMLHGALKTAMDMVHERDPETGAHLQRMARFSRLIALELAASGAERMDDEFIEQLFLFAPLHDVGKIGIPDAILLKQDLLTPEEFEVMKTHSRRGAQIVDALLANFELGELPFADMLRHVAALHHESLDGSGYPGRLRNGQIPLDARIVAVADVFDALTSRRPYKEPWDNEQAFATLRSLATKLDQACVEALARRRLEVEEVQASFRDACVTEPPGVSSDGS